MAHSIIDQLVVFVVFFISIAVILWVGCYRSWSMNELSHCESLSWKKSCSKRINDGGQVANRQTRYQEPNTRARAMIDIKTQASVKYP